MKVVAFFTEWFNRLIGRLAPNSLLQRVPLEVYQSISQGYVFQKLDAEEAEGLRQSIQTWLFEKDIRGRNANPVAYKLINRTQGNGFYKPTGHVLVADDIQSSLISAEAARRGMVEVIAEPNGLYIALFEAFADGHRKTTDRFRVYVGGMNRRYIFRYMNSDHDHTFEHVTYHESEFSYERNAPLSIWFIPASHLPESLLARMPVTKMKSQ